MAAEKSNMKGPDVDQKELLSADAIDPHVALDHFFQLVLLHSENRAIWEEQQEQPLYAYSQALAEGRAGLLEKRSGATRQGVGEKFTPDR